MGCLTGFYLIIKDQQPCETIGKLMIDAFEFAANFKDKVPGTDAVNCGNYLMHNIHYARYEAAKFVEILKTSPCYEYPKAERLDTEKGKFFDS
jgi:S-ribosylhomocysteine lyase